MIKNPKYISKGTSDQIQIWKTNKHFRSDPWPLVLSGPKFHETVMRENVRKLNEDSYLKIPELRKNVRKFTV